MTKRAPTPTRQLVQTLTRALLAGLAIAYITVLALAALTPETLSGFWPFSLVGLAGALVANSTGVGGGVVFVPVFSMLRESGTLALSPDAAVGVSFAIQCFGMTIGGLTWLNRYYRVDVSPAEIAHRPLVGSIIFRVLATALPAMLVTQFALRIDGDFAFLLFKLFSISLGSLLLIQVLFFRQPARDRDSLSERDRLALPLIGAAGGVATAMFSVGVGELLALALFLRRYPVDVCVSTAVIASAISVWTGVVFHILAGNLVWEILVFAAPAVAIGGFLARRLAHALGAYRLKLMTSIWIVGSSLILLSL